MKNYVKINGVNSNTITGLMINELPPISKPEMRTLTEEIDGRDGDIITDLGYSSYDKTITIGLFGNGYDINDIIAFFNGEGTIVFSNEDDKYYNFKIINKIDYERLQKFKTASITFHCQPFKYPLEETPLEIEYEYVNGEGESITLNNTEGDVALQLDLKGNTSQYSTTGKNLEPNTLASGSNSGITYTINEDKSITLNGNNTSGSPLFIRLASNYILSAGTYTLSNSNSESSFSKAVFYDDGGNFTSHSNIETKTFESEITIKPYLYIKNGVQFNNFTIYPMIESGSSMTDYEPYTNGASPNPNYPQQIHEVSGDNTIEVCGKNYLPTLDSNTWTLENGATISNGILTLPNANSRASITIRWDKTLYCYESVELVSGTAIYTAIYIYDENMELIDYFGRALPNLSVGDRPEIDWRGRGAVLSSTKFIKVVFSRQTTYAPNEYSIKFAQISKNSNDTYEPYNGDTYEIDLRTSKNLFNKYGETLVDKTFGTNGAIIDSTSDSVLLDYIAVKPNTTYTLSGTNWARLHEYNESKVSIAHINPINANSVTITTTSQTRYVRIGYVTTKKDTVQFEKGSSATSYVPYNSLKMRGIGTYEDYFTKNSGKNLAIKNIKGYIDRNNNVVKIDNASESFVFYAKKGETYCCSSLTSYNTGWIGKVETDNVVNDTPITDIKDVRYQGGGVKTFTSDFTGYCVVYVNTTLNNAIKDTFMLNEGSTPLPYEPYGTGQWCKYNAIGEVVLDGTNNSFEASRSTNTTGVYRFRTYDIGCKQTSSSSEILPVLCNKLLKEALDDTYIGNQGISGVNSNDGRLMLFITEISQYTLEQANTWLTTNNLIAYYPLATPYLELITNNTLKSQLDIIEKALAKQGQTNISQVNNDKAFIISASAMKEGTNEIKVENIGNIYSRPTLDIKGNGTINVYKDNTQLLQLDMSETNEIVIEDMEAYNPSTNELMNRKVIGDYSKITCPSGTCIYKVDGDLTKMTITNYTRWL